MVETKIVDGWFRVKFTGWDLFWALRKDIAVPLNHISGAHIEPVTGIIARYGPMQRMGGTWYVGKIMAGQFTTMRKFTDANGNSGFGVKWLFWCVHRSPEAVVIKLIENSFIEVVLEVPDMPGLVKEINDAIAQGTTPAPAV
jgi:hypothetical protein